MRKIFALIWEAVCWGQIFLSAAGLIAIVAGMLYGYAHVPEWVAWSVVGFGVVVGVLVAERIRRRMGCTAFFGRVYGAP